MSLSKKKHLFNTANILSPKRDMSAKTGNASWFPYYAGFSPDFARTLCQSMKMREGSSILDPWNGSGTTTIAASSLGLNSIGIDLNPVMVIAAKARSLSLRTKHSLKSLTYSIIDKAVLCDFRIESDPLNTWIIPSSTHHIRKLENAIQVLLVDGRKPVNFVQREQVDSLSDLAAFFYIALFRTVRILLNKYIGSNPTWVKKPNNLRSRIRPSFDNIHCIFKSVVFNMIDAIEDSEFIGTNDSARMMISVASSTALPINDSSVDFVLSSPPYCTRIDYAVATSPELSLLGFQDDTSYKILRQSLLGTSITSTYQVSPKEEWGETCLSFLNLVKCHSSKASSTYYYNTHLQYFSGISESIGELKRVLKKNAGCVLVVQDSHYKELHNDVPQMITEMAINQGFHLLRNEAFDIQKTMARLNPKVKKYRSHPVSTEYVLCLER
jgi:DNA modification methylase